MTDMDSKCYLFLGIILYLATTLESRVIVPRETSEEIPLSINSLEDDKKFGIKPAVWGPPTDDIEYSDNPGIIDPVFRPPIDDYDYKPGRDVDSEDSRAETNPERFPINADREKRPNESPEEKDDVDKSDDEYFINPDDIENPDKSDSNDKDFKSLPDEDKPVNKNGDESEEGDIDLEESEVKNSGKEPEDEEIPDEERKEDDAPVEDDNSKEHKPEDEEIPDEERKEDERVEDDNKTDHKLEDEEKLNEEESKDDTNDKDHIPEDEEKFDEETKEDEEEVIYEPENDDGRIYIPEENSTDDEKKDVDEGTVSHEDDKNRDESIPQEGESSFFDTPFFNLEQVQKYFSKLNRALSHVFRPSLDDYLLLNGTYANTTEEVDIGGQKYIITKSVLKRRDNNSMVYVESLSTKPKMNESEVVEDVDIKNVTST